MPVSATQHAGQQLVIYTCPMHPQIRQAGAGSTLIAQYQVELFWTDLAFNAGGIIYIGNKVVRATRYS